METITKSQFLSNQLDTGLYLLSDVDEVYKPVMRVAMHRQSNYYRIGLREGTSRKTYWWDGYFTESEAYYKSYSSKETALKIIESIILYKKELRDLCTTFEQQCVEFANRIEYPLDLSEHYHLNTLREGDLRMLEKTMQLAHSIHEHLRTLE